MIFGSSTSPTFTASYTGFVGGQTAVSLGFIPTFNVMTIPLPGSAQTVGSGTPVGTYAIVPSGLTSNNYGFTYSYGVLSVGAWTITGFYQPVDMTGALGYVINTVKGGSTVPLKFNIYAGTPGPLTERKSVSDVMFGAVQFAEYPCTQTPGFETPLEISNTGNTSLRYDTTGVQFIQNWQTPKVPNKCYQVRMTALDGSHIDAYFKTK